MVVEVMASLPMDLWLSELGGARPVTIDGCEYYVAVLHPRWKQTWVGTMYRHQRMRKRLWSGMR